MRNKQKLGLREATGEGDKQSIDEDCETDRKARKARRGTGR